MKIAHLDELWTCGDPVEQARRIICIAHKMYRPRKTFCLFSGGNDSACSTHIAMATGLCDGVVSIDTTVAIEESHEHLRSVAGDFKWPLMWLTPDMSYFQFCAKFGVPGPGMHAYVYAYLKERCVRGLVRYFKKFSWDKIMLVTGVRASESERRMGHVAAIARDGAQLWVAPIINWDEQQKVVYQTEHAIRRNPVTTNLGISGECLCGAFAKPGEMGKIKEFYPRAFSHIQNCEANAAENGKHCAWGMRPTNPPRPLMLCSQCERKQ